MNPADKNIVLGDFNCTLLKSLDRKPIPNRDDIGSTPIHFSILIQYQSNSVFLVNTRAFRFLSSAITVVYPIRNGHFKMADCKSSKR
jgi:hypothetical protein